MGTKISWADETWNPIVGCSKISAGCTRCYAEKMAYRLASMGIPFYDMVQEEGFWNGRIEFVESALTKPLHWRRPRRIFVCSMSDLFHESISFDWIDRVFAVMALCPQHQFMCLTKRAKRMREYIYSVRHDPRINHAIIAMDEKYTANMVHWPLPNIHLGVTVENQDNVGRIADLIQTPAAKRFISFEPLLSRVDISCPLNGINCAVVGCESGPKARLCNLNDLMYLVNCLLCEGVKVHVKQIPLDGKCNKEISQWPEEFRIREV